MYNRKVHSIGGKMGKKLARDPNADVTEERRELKAALLEQKIIEALFEEPKINDEQRKFLSGLLSFEKVS